MDLMKALTSQYMKPELPEMRVGDTVRAPEDHRRYPGENSGVRGHHHCPQAWRHWETITVRRISYGVGCEKVFGSWPFGL